MKSAEASGAFITGQEIVEMSESLFQYNTYDEDYSRRIEEENLIAYDLRLGQEVYLSSEEVPRHVEQNGLVIVKPGEFALLTTEEILKVPGHLIGFISMRFNVKARGLINVSGFQVNPGYRGRLVFSVYNAGPTEVVLRRGERVFIILFAKVTRSLTYRGKYQDMMHIPVDMIAALKGTPISPRQLNQKLERLGHEVRIHSVLIAALITALLSLSIHLLRR